MALHRAKSIRLATRVCTNYDRIDAVWVDLLRAVGPGQPISMPRPYWNTLAAFLPAPVHHTDSGPPKVARLHERFHGPSSKSIPGSRVERLGTKTIGERRTWMRILRPTTPRGSTANAA